MGRRIDSAGVLLLSFRYLRNAKRNLYITERAFLPFVKQVNIVSHADKSLPVKEKTILQKRKDFYMDKVTLAEQRKT